MSKVLVENNIIMNLQMPSNLTDEQFYEFCQVNKELKIERNAEGEVSLMPPTGGITGKYNFKLAKIFGKWEDRHTGGVFFDSSTGFTLPNKALRSPDIAWVKQDRWDALTKQQQETFVPLSPDFVLELRSATDSLKSLQKKMVEYINNGTILGWLLDTHNKDVYIYQIDKPMQHLHNPISISADPLLPGFELFLSEIW